MVSHFADVETAIRTAYNTEGVVEKGSEGRAPVPRVTGSTHAGESGRFVLFRVRLAFDRVKNPQSDGHDQEMG